MPGRARPLRRPSRRGGRRCAPPACRLPTARPTGAAGRRRRGAPRRHRGAAPRHPPTAHRVAPSSRRAASGHARPSPPSTAPARGTTPVHCARRGRSRPSPRGACRPTRARVTVGGELVGELLADEHERLQLLDGLVEEPFDTMLLRRLGGRRRPLVVAGGEDVGVLAGWAEAVAEIAPRQRGDGAEGRQAEAGEQAGELGVDLSRSRAARRRVAGRGSHARHRGRRRAFVTAWPRRGGPPLPRRSARRRCRCPIRFRLDDSCRVPRRSPRRCARRGVRRRRSSATAHGPRCTAIPARRSPAAA